MKGLKLNVRVEGVARSCLGFDGVIIEVIQLAKNKKYKVRWSTGVVEVYFSKALEVWGQVAVREAIRVAARNARAGQAVVIAAVNHNEAAPESSDSSDDDDDSNINYGSR
jgi:hypothetical protein